MTNRMGYVLSILLSVPLVACPPTKGGSQACADCSVIIILVDALRADHLSFYGYDRLTSPNIAAFAESAVVFDQARSQASCTWPSVNSLLTSRNPFNFLGRPDGIGIPEAITSLPEILKAKGYRTIAVSGSPVVRNTPSDFNGQAGFGRGFDIFDECECIGEGCTWKYKPHATCIEDRALSHLAQLSHSGQPFFLYLHYMDVHSPYAPPGEDRAIFGTPYRGNKAWVRAGAPNPIERMLSGTGPDVGLTDQDLAHLIDLYDDEIHYFDSRFQELLNAIDRSGLGEKTLLVFIADHGEEFMEHGSIKHCHTLFDTEIRTPLVIRLPSRTLRGRRAALAENLDVVPTILDYVGVDASAHDFDGVSLRAAIEDDTPVRDFSFSSQNAFRAVIGQGYKMILDLERNHALLFDLNSDPKEEVDVAAANDGTVAELEAQLLGWIRAVEGSGTADAFRRSREISRETEERLRAIGYIE